MRIMSNGCCPTRESASTPPAAVTTEWPLRVSTVEASARLTGSSSTTRIVSEGVSGLPHTLRSCTAVVGSRTGAKTGSEVKGGSEPYFAFQPDRALHISCELG